jgi:vacuolar iron transporter family protein
MMPMAERPADIQRYKSNWQGEIEAAEVYRAMAAAANQPSLKELYLKLAEVEEKHATLWENEMRKAQYSVPARRLGFKARFRCWLAKRYGPDAVLPSMAAGETADFQVYDNQPEAGGSALPKDERSHARVLNLLSIARPAWAPTTGSCRT